MMIFAMITCCKIMNNASALKVVSTVDWRSELF